MTKLTGELLKFEKKEISIMTALTMTNKAVTNHGMRTGKLSLKERFIKYMEENGAQIVCGFLALNGNFHACRFYLEQTGNR